MNTEHIPAPINEMVAAPGQLYNANYGGYVTNTESIYDYSQEKTQEEFNREIVDKINSIDGSSETSGYTKLEIDNKFDTVNSVINNLQSNTSEINSSITNLTEKNNQIEQDIAQINSNVSNIKNYKQIIKFNGFIPQATILNQSLNKTSDEGYIYFMNDQNTFGISETLILDTMQTSMPTLYINWSDRQDFTKYILNSNMTTPYDDKIYIHGGKIYVWIDNTLSEINSTINSEYYPE